MYSVLLYGCDSSMGIVMVNVVVGAVKGNPVVSVDLIVVVVV
jgi:hypothetical protein